MKLCIVHLVRFSLVLLFSMSAAFACADIIVEFENDDLAASSATAAPDTVLSGVSASNLTLNGLNTNAGWPNALTGVQNNASINSLATAISSGHYYSFTVTPDAGASMSYSDLFFRYSLQANAFPATTQFSLLNSLTGFSTGNVIDSFSGSATAAGANHGSDLFDISGAAALQNVAAGTAIEFRVYLHNTGGGNMTRIGNGRAFATNDNADLTLNGTLTNAVPEPSSLGLFGVAFIGMCSRRKRSA